VGKPATQSVDTMLQVGRTFGVRDGMLRLQYELQRGSGLLSWRDALRAGLGFMGPGSASHPGRGQHQDEEPRARMAPGPFFSGTPGALGASH
jgi:hypothetical protein